MSGFKILIVDDSPFSRTLLAETIREIGCDPVGEVDSLDTLVEAYSSCKPDIVTMDLVMPDADGFEYSRALFLHDPNVKIILISSMKDEETETEAKRLGIAGYLQKPVDGETLERIFNNVMSPDSLFVQLQERGPDVFKEALAQNVTRMTKAPVTFVPSEITGQQFTSQGITTVLGIIGRHSGTMILDMATETAEQIVASLLHRQPKSSEETLAMVAELGNVIGGVACSMLNKHDKSFGLRVSPPSLFSGDTAQVASPKLDLQSCFAETEFGRIFLGIGFKKGNVLWM